MLAKCILITFLLGLVGQPTFALDKSSAAMLEKVLEALDMGLEFMQQEHKKINLDAVIGTRLVEGQLLVLLRHLDSADGVTISSDTRRRITDLFRKANQVSNMANSYVALSQPQYYKRLGPTIAQGFWTQDYASRNINPSLLMAPRILGEAMHERDSDNCLTELFGTSGRSSFKCDVSPHCWRLMTSRGYMLYSLSHQVFYLEIGQAFGCFSGSMFPLTDALNAGFCANMLSETHITSALGFPEDKQDIFMEQQALCGILGYREFFRVDWLKKILEWQRLPRGCWGNGKTVVNEGGFRIKREERNFPDGCQSHRTAVALGALIQYARYIIEGMQL